MLTKKYHLARVCFDRPQGLQWTWFVHTSNGEVPVRPYVGCFALLLCSWLRLQLHKWRMCGRRL